ncbi:MAG: DUF192 domain-containing protein [Candidatus Omnitrophota bacterium]
MKRIAILVSLVFFAAYSWASEKKKICVHNTCIVAEVVRSEALQQRGLSGREKLSDAEGMLFVFGQEARYSFWMKGMKFSLDIIWIAGDGTIVDIKEQQRPCEEFCESLVPAKKALYVLEVTSGFAKRHNIAVGSKVRF